MNEQFHAARADQLADELRRVLVALNGGAVGLVLGLAAARPDRAAAWRYSLGLFLVGLIVVCISLLLAKHRALRRRDAARAGQSEPNFRPVAWSFIWDGVALALFVVGAVLALAMTPGG